MVASAVVEHEARARRERRQLGRIRELVAQEDKSLKLQDLPNKDAEPLKFAFLRFSDQICAEAFETPSDGATCVVHQLSKHLQIPRAKLEDLVEASVAER